MTNLDPARVKMALDDLNTLQMYSENNIGPENAKLLSETIRKVLEELLNGNMVMVPIKPTIPMLHAAYEVAVDNEWVPDFEEEYEACIKASPYFTAQKDETQ